ncbi:MAG: hypothetical protein EA425_11255 [Puniceicoccaceae bacterium]|nr:MAG: hypothetical protein EA425_11255 [Puniceicoccaceae bacterium]
MARLLFLCFFLPAGLIASAFAPPPGYYEGLDGKTGASLEAALREIIADHTVIPYITEPYRVLDADFSQTGNILLIFSGFSVPFGSFPVDWNREHIWPRSRGVGDVGPDHSDLHAFRPINPSVNSARSNLPFGRASPFLPGYLPPGSYPLAPLVARDSTAWEPPDDDKGRVARAIFYMAVRYDGSEPNTENLRLTNSPPLSGPWGNTMGYLDDLIEWNRRHPPESAERRRNQQIFARYQHNRNPFVDHPDLAEAVFLSASVPSWGRWRILHFTLEEWSDPEISGFLGDPDRDGIPNLHEWAFGLNPRVPSQSGLPRVSMDPDGGLTLTYRRLHQADQAGLFYMKEYSTDLVEWRPWPGSSLIQETAFGALRLRTVRPNWPDTAPDTVFLRIRVERD